MAGSLVLGVGGTQRWNERSGVDRNVTDYLSWDQATKKHWNGSFSEYRNIDSSAVEQTPLAPRWKASSSEGRNPIAVHK